MPLKPKDKKRMQKFRANLTRIRTEKGLSQRQLATLCDVTHGKISKLENDEDSSLTLPTLFELAKGLGVHPKELIDYEVEWLRK